MGKDVRVGCRGWSADDGGGAAIAPEPAKDHRQDGAEGRQDEPRISEAHPVHFLVVLQQVDPECQQKQSPETQHGDAQSAVGFPTVEERANMLATVPIERGERDPAEQDRGKEGIGRLANNADHARDGVTQRHEIEHKRQQHDDSVEPRQRDRLIVVIGVVRSYPLSSVAHAPSCCLA